MQKGMEKSRCRLSGVIKSAFDAVMSAIRGVDPKIGMIPELKKAMELIGSFIDLLPSSTPTNIITEILSFLERVQGWIKRFRGDPWYETWIESTTKDGEMAYEISKRKKRRIKLCWARFSLSMPGYLTLIFRLHPPPDLSLSRSLSFLSLCIYVHQ
mmetsp:Transcript_44377/g.74025  ORF Transcript_44377/g.74025 Transcript_44377/m.74025 type:complete len:156 (-) Transcript_44377:983-1450(-)